MKKVFPIGAAAAIAFGVFVALAQAQAIYVPYFTPTTIEFRGLEEQYPIDGTMDYEISLKGYGSNCIAFKAEIVHRDGYPERGQPISYTQILDCRKLEITEGPYNYTRSFSYAGPYVLGRPGIHDINVEVLDQITRQNYTDTRSFIVVEDSSQI